MGLRTKLVRAIRGWRSQCRDDRQLLAIDVRPNITTVRLPSPWIGQFQTESDFTRAMAMAPRLGEIIGHIDDHLVASRHPKRFPAYCVACESVQVMRLDWCLAGTLPDGSVHPAWTETSVCEQCRLNSRMRAVLSFVVGHEDYSRQSACYLAERVTASHTAFQPRFERLESSEYLGADFEPGEVVRLPEGSAVRHEDLTRLSFRDGSFDWVVTQDVFEHIPNYPAAFSECCRVLAKGGHLVFSVPFASSLSKTQVRAVATEDGGITHLLPPEIHGNPVSGEGSLCFQNFGWDILDSLRDAGFVSASAHAYWGPWLGHVGLGGMVFCAGK